MLPPNPEKVALNALLAGNVEYVKKIVENKPGIAREKYKGEIKTRIKGKEESFYDSTLLYIASAKGCTDLVKTLISKGADVNAKDVYGNTPLKWAINRGHKAVADLLRKHGGKE